MKLIAKKLIVAFLILTTFVSVQSVYNYSLADNSEIQEIDGSTQHRYADYIDDINIKHPSVSISDKEYSVNGVDYTDTDVPDLQVEDSAVITPDNGYVEWTINVEQEGLYNIFIEYRHVIDAEYGRTLEGKRSSAVRTMSINGEIPFFEANNFTFSRIWMDNLEDGKIKRDDYGNDIRPMQKEAKDNGFIIEPLKDYMGYYN